MPTRKRLIHLADRAVDAYDRPNKYEKRFNKFWDALDKRKGFHVAEDTAGQKLLKFSQMNDAPLGETPTSPAQQALKRKIKK
jgi:hypothetical protein